MGNAASALLLSGEEVTRGGVGRRSLARTLDALIGGALITLFLFIEEDSWSGGVGLFGMALIVGLNLGRV